MHYATYRLMVGCNSNIESEALNNSLEIKMVQLANGIPEQWPGAARAAARLRSELARKHSFTTPSPGQAPLVEAGPRMTRPHSLKSVSHDVPQRVINWWRYRFPG